MSSNHPAPFEIFMPGTHTSVDGRVISFSAEQLADAAASYDATDHPAPLVIGHPAIDAPAYGWVAGLAVEDGRLVATPSDVVPEFAEAVRAKRYRKVSASFYPEAHPANPTPGKLYLKHVGFLGAAAPAVKGLKPLSFSAEQSADTLTFETDFQETFMAGSASNQNGNPTPGQNNDGSQIAFAEREAALTAREAEIATRETAAQERERALKAEAAALRHEGSVAFAEAQLIAGKLAPAGKALVIGLLDTLDASVSLNFGEASGELTPADAFRKLFEGAHPVVSFGEAAPADREEGGKLDESDPHVIAAKADAFAESERAAGRTVSAAAAVRRVLRDSTKA